MHGLLAPQNVFTPDSCRRTVGFDLCRSRTGPAEWQPDADQETLLRIAVALVPFWEVRGHLSEGRRWLALGLDLRLAGSVSNHLRPRALLGAGRLAFWQGDLTAALEHFDQSLAVARQLGDEQLIADALTWLGAVRGARAEYREAEQLLNQRLVLKTALGDAWGGAWTLWNLGRAAGNRFWEYGDQDDAVRAYELLEESLRRFRGLGDLRFVAITCTFLGTGYGAEGGDSERSSILLREGLAGLRQVGDRAYLFASLFSLAAVACRTGHPLRAARFLGAAEAVSSALGTQLGPIQLAVQEGVLRRIRPLLSEAELAAARSTGPALSLDEVLIEAWESASLAPSNDTLDSPTPILTPVSVGIGSNAPDT